MTTPPSCSTCADLIDGQCRGSTPLRVNLLGDAGWPRVRDPTRTVCRQWNPTPIGGLPPGPPRPPVVVVVLWPTEPPPGPHRRSLWLLVALLTVAALLASATLATVALAPIG